MINASWQAAHDRFHAHLMPQLRQRGPELGAAARAGNADAQEVVKYYAMLCRSFDPLSADLLEAAFQRYCETQTPKFEDQACD